MDFPVPPPQFLLLLDAILHSEHWKPFSFYIQYMNLGPRLLQHLLSDLFECGCFRIPEQLVPNKMPGICFWGGVKKSGNNCSGKQIAEKIVSGKKMSPQNHVITMKNAFRRKCVFFMICSPSEKMLSGKMFFPKKTLKNQQRFSPRQTCFPFF